VLEVGLSRRLGDREHAHRCATTSLTAASPDQIEVASANAIAESSCKRLPNPLRCRDAGNFNKGVTAVTMEGQHTAPPYPQFRDVTDKVLKAPDNSWSSSTGSSLNIIGPAGRLRGFFSWGGHAVYHACILNGSYSRVPGMHVKAICASV
jgi:hypothetical protein